MNKMNCDIIKDLIPSYMDRICSEATRQCVEEHIAGCDRCRQLISFYGDHTLSGEKLEQESVDGLKKIKRLLHFRKVSYYLILAAILLLVFWMFVPKVVSHLTDSILFLLFLICILATVVSTLLQKGNTPLGITEYLMGAASLVISVYFILAYFYLAGRVRMDADTAFGLLLNETGPFLEKQIIAAFILQGIFFVHNLSCIVNQGKKCSWLLCLNLSGIFLMLRFDLWMYRMDSPEFLLKVIRDISLSTAAVAVLGIAACLLLGRCVRKRK